MQISQLRLIHLHCPELNVLVGRVQLVTAHAHVHTHTPTHTRTRTQTHMQSGQLNTYSTAHYVGDRAPDGTHSLYHIVIGSHQENHTSLVLQQSNWTDVFPMRHFLSHIEKQFSLQIPLSVSTDCSKQALCKQNDIFLDAYNQTVNNYSSSLCR